MGVSYVDKNSVNVPRFHGKYAATVYDNNDPTQQFRVRATVPYVLGDQVSLWALPIGMCMGPQQGIFMLPAVGAKIWIEFEDGNVSKPLWLGGFPITAGTGGMNTPQSTKAGYPNVNAIRTSSGHEITFDNTSAGLSFKITSASGHTIVVNDIAKNISITSHGGHNVILDDILQHINLKSHGGHVVTMDDLVKVISLTTAGGHSHVMDDNAKQIRITDSLGNQMLMDANAGVAKIQHKLATGETHLIQTVDHSINQAAAAVGLGDLHVNLDPVLHAAINKAILSTFENNMYVQRLNDMKNVITALITAMQTSGVPSLPTIAAAVADIASLLHISVPNGSSVVLIKP